MKKFIINKIGPAAVGLLVLCGFTAAAEPLKMREVFADLPNTTLDLLSRSTRLDMMDYLEADSLKEVTNTMGGVSVIEKHSPSYLKVRITPVSTMELKILDTKDKKMPQIIMAVYTVGDEAETSDSQIFFYSPEMKPLEVKKYISMPKLKDFFSFPKGSETGMKDIEEIIPFPAYRFRLSEEGGEPILNATLTVDKLLPLEERKLVELFLRPALTWQWTGKEWKQK